jgi:acetyl esterase
MHRRAIPSLSALLLAAGCSSGFMGGGMAQTQAPQTQSQVADPGVRLDRVIARPEDTAGFADPDMAAVLRNLAGLGARPFEQLTPEQARRQATPADAVKAVLTAHGRSTAPEGVGETRDIVLPLADGRVAGRIYLPSRAAAGPLPVILYFHGGGWVVADLDTYDATPRALANATGAMVLSAHYRQAPEFKFPAAHDDAWGTYLWVVANAAQVGGDPTRIAVAGESAGGNLAAYVSIHARESGIRMPIHQLLVYPVAGGDDTTPSYRANAGAAPLGRGGMNWFLDHYLASPRQRTDTRINLVAADLRGLPQTTIILAEIDPLYSEGLLLGQRLAAAGVQVETRTFLGVTHEFFGAAPVVADARAAQQFAGQRLRAALSSSVAGR